MHPLARYLRENNKTQRWLAEQIGVREQAVTTWVKGHFSPRITHVQRIAELTKGAVPAEAWFEVPSSPAVVPERPQVNREKEDCKEDEVDQRVVENIEVAVDREADCAQEHNSGGALKGRSKAIHSCSSPQVAAE